MGGDLNLKKSWHPVLMSNQRRVWEEEKKALDERKRTEQMMKERQEERQIQELQEMQEASGGNKRLNRVDWMYTGPAAGQLGTTEEMEGYLLGKRRVDGLLKGTENQKLEKAASEESFMALQKANTARDTTMKIREDPMLAIKKQEQAAYEALMNDPVKRRLLLKAAGVEISAKDESNKDRKHRNHRHHEDHNNRHKRRKIEGEGQYERRSKHHHHHRHRRHSESLNDSRSPLPYRRRSPSPYRWRSRSPISSHRRQSESDPRRQPRMMRYRSPSESPPEGNGFHKLKPSKSWHNSIPRKPVIDTKSPLQGHNEDKAARLAAMQRNASDLEEDRAKRIAAIEEQEKADLRAEEMARARSARYGSKGDFVNNLNRKAGELDIGERMRRGRTGMEKVRSHDD